MRKVLIFDTSILCIWLDVPGRTVCGPMDDRWDKARRTSGTSGNSKTQATIVNPMSHTVLRGFKLHYPTVAGQSLRTHYGNYTDTVQVDAVEPEQ
jgi:hypothetical protein